MAPPPLPPTASKGPIGLALAALIVGIGAFLFGLIPVFGALVGAAAIVLGVLALRKKQPKVLAIIGIALGAIAAISSITTAAGLGAAVNHASSDKPAAVAAAPDDATEPDASAAAPEPTQEPAAPAAPAVPAEYKSAVTSADSYSKIMHMSKAKIYDQLTSEYGEKFTPEAGQYAIDNMVADWNANALASAKSYQQTMSMSPAAIHDQLTSEYGEKFTPAEADFAIAHLND